MSFFNTNTGKVSFLSNGIRDICLIDSCYGSFFAALNAQIDNDNIHEMFRRGECIPFCEWIFDGLFPSGVFLDLGANIGAFSLLLAKKGHKCIAFEAAPENAFLLWKSTVLNTFDIRVFEKAVYSHTGTIKFLSLNQFGFVVTDVMDGHTAAEGYGSQIYEMPCAALDDLQNEVFLPNEKIGFIKMDIEGSEVAALRGMRNVLSVNDYPPILMEINPWTLFLLNETPYSLFTLASELGYTAYKVAGEYMLTPHPQFSFHTESMQDVLLLKDVPDSVTIVPSPVPTLKDEIEWVKSKLITRKTWLHHEHRIIYNLKDFPALFNEPEINKLLMEIAASGNNPLMTNKAITWFKSKSEEVSNG